MGDFLVTKAYWWTREPNFGDALAPYLLERFADVVVTRSPVADARVICGGSVLEHVPPEWDGFILGAGKLFESSRLHLHTGTARVVSLRGPYSASGVDGSFALGDPGLLADELVGPQEKQHALGIVPHWSDTELEHRPEFQQYRPLVIRPGQDPLEVVRQIGSCCKIVTSSLHGMIVADSFGIPRRFEPPSHAFANEGGLYKFRDYSASLQLPFVVGETVRASRFAVEDAKDAVFAAFRQLGAELREDHLLPSPPAPAPTGKGISILIPYEYETPWREEVLSWVLRYWAHELPGAQVIIGRDSSVRGQPFSKSTAVNNAFRQASGDIIAVLDSDCYLPGAVLLDCAEQMRHARGLHRKLWFIPYHRFYRLTRQATQQVLSSPPDHPVRPPFPPPPDWVEFIQEKGSSHGHWFGALAQVMPREAFTAAHGFDQRFRDWGGEDVSFMRAVDALYARHHTTANPVWHLWHPRNGTTSLERHWDGGRAGSNDSLASRYTDAIMDPGAMRVLVQEDGHGGLSD